MTPGAERGRQDQKTVAHRFSVRRSIWTVRHGVSRGCRACAACLSLVPLIVAGAMLGCASRPQAVPVIAAPLDLSLLAGAWEGQYLSLEAGRSGSITFSLEAGTDTAFGQVLMVPRTMPPLRNPSGVHYGDAYRMPPMQPLTIGFVRAVGGAITGTIAPYYDAECGCTRSAVFRGRVENDLIKGEFISRPEETGDAFSGEWEVRRMKK